MLNTLKDRWFLVLLAAVLVAGLQFSAQLAGVAAKVPQNWVIAIVLLMMALPLEIDTMWATLRRPGAATLAVAVNLVFVPLAAFAASRLLIEDLAIGLIIAGAVPSTLASAAVWTRLAGGNDAVSLLVTMITNLSCFLVTPAWVGLLVGQGTATKSFGEMAMNLLVVVVLPIVVAQLLRSSAPIGRWATVNKRGLGAVAQLGILSIVFVGAVECGLKLAQLHETMRGLGSQIALMLVTVAAVHLAAWWFGFVAAGKLGLARPEQLAVAFSGSQKTLMVGLAVALEFGGLAVLPMVAYHVGQLLLDTLIADRCRSAARH